MSEGEKDGMTDFKPIPGYSEYRINTSGDVLNKYGRLLSPHNNDGYLNLKLNGDNGVRRNIGIHRLVWLAHAGPIPEGYWINHKDGVKSNNHISNLECDTPTYNLHHARDVLGRKFGHRVAPGELHPKAVLTDEAVNAIRSLASIGWTHRRLSKLFEVSTPCVTLIVGRKRRKELSDPSLCACNGVDKT